MRSIIFHCPFILNDSAKSASGIRPIKMLEAFKAIGCDVDLISGSSLERKKIINKIKQKIKEGKKYDFVYSESSTMPNALTDSHHFPIRPLVDYNFFKLMKRNNIPVGLFYRDVYWLFSNYGNHLPWYKKELALFFYRQDLAMYNKFVEKLYLPSLNMAKYIKINKKDIFDDLPPAHDMNDYSHIVSYKKELKLLYIGGIGPDYKMHKLIEALRLNSKVKLILCTRENDWNLVKSEYGDLPENVEIVHKSGSELKQLYKESHIATLFVEPHEYREFAVPFKLYEYLGMNKPILCTQPSLVGNFVREKGIGWAINYDVDDLVDFFDNFSEEKLSQVIERVLTVKSQETWEIRAKKVVADLSKTKENLYK
ncbi:glycosyltransferase [Acinetobacter sp. YH16058]|uniref:glycosyltransferase n=1 Tax=Acinetobacter sp. YH16058 TaxID=2601196 RepID=UPI0015D3DFF4|nr:glycosyltransferase [Acinetobacter sp. YH16058]